MNKIYTTILFAFATLLPAAAQQRVWNLTDCMIYAVENNYNVRRSAIDQLDNRHNYTNAWTSHLPSLSGSVNASTNFGRGIDPKTNTYINTTNFNNGYGGNASITVFNGFALWNTTRYNKIAMLKGVESQQKAADDAALSTMLAYIEVVYNNGLVDLSTNKIEESRQTLLLATRQGELGIKSLADVAQVQADLAKEEYTLIVRQNDLTNSVLKLKNSMNYPINDSLPIEYSLPEVTLTVDDQSASELFEQAKLRLPQAKIEDLTLQGFKLKYSIAKGSMLPSISAGGGISTSYFKQLAGNNENDDITKFTDQFRDNVGKSLSVQLNIPIFDGLYRRTNMKIAKNSVSRAKENFSEAMRNLQSEIEKTLGDCRSAERQWIQAKRSVEATDLAYRANLRKYKEGLLGIIELQTSSNSLMQARIEMLNSQLTYTALCRQVNFYNGVPFIE